MDVEDLKKLEKGELPEGVSQHVVDTAMALRDLMQRAMNDKDLSEVDKLSLRLKMTETMMKIQAKTNIQLLDSVMELESQVKELQEKVSKLQGLADIVG